jgi:tripeptidyl-peptidase-1
MFLRQSVLLFLAIASPIVCSPTFGIASKKYGEESKVVEKLSAPPEGWVKDAEAKIDKEKLLIKLRIHLTHRDMDKFHDLAMNVSLFHVTEEYPSPNLS